MLAIVNKLQARKVLTCSSICHTNALSAKDSQVISWLPSVPRSKMRILATAQYAFNALLTFIPLCKNRINQYKSVAFVARAYKSQSRLAWSSEIKQINCSRTPNSQIQRSLMLRMSQRVTQRKREKSTPKLQSSPLPGSMRQHHLAGNL